MSEPKKTIELEINEQLKELFDSFRSRFEYVKGSAELTKIQVNTENPIEKHRLTLIASLMADYKLFEIEIKRSGKGLKIELFKN